MKNIVPYQKTKKKNSTSCNKCNSVILIGEKYISAIYEDGYLKKPYGAFHLVCWAELADKGGEG